MMIPIKIICASLNFQRLDEHASSILSGAHLETDTKTILNFKKDVGFPLEQLAIIKKCNAVILVFCYYGDFSNDFVHGRILDTWDKFARVGISDFIKYIKFFEDNDAIKYLGECAIGLHSITVGDSQVMSQICDSLQSASNSQPENPTFSILISWLKNLTAEVELKTALFEGNTSVERIASEIISQKIKKDETISLIGYGRSGKLITKILNKELGYHVKIANRTTGVFSDIKKEKNIDIIDFSNYAELLNSDCVVLAVDSNKETEEYSKKLLQNFEKIKSKQKLFVDLTSPTLFKKAGNKNIITINDISIEANKNLDKRINEVNKAREIVDKQSITVIKNLNREIGKIVFDKQKKEVVCKLENDKLEILKIRNDAYKSIRQYLDKLDFVEVNSPYIVGISTDPPKVDKGQTIDVFWQEGTKAFLRQSNQLYKQIIVVSGLPKIYEIGPFWRAEVSQSYRHLQESIGLDIELSQPKDLKELYRLAYSIILNVKKHIWNKYNIENVDLIFPNPDLVPVITYIEAVTMLNSRGYVLALGEDLGLMGEAKLGQIIKRDYNSDVFIVINYPDTIKKFYTRKIKNGNTETFDIIVSGWEVVSGALRETNREKIEKSMQLSKINPQEYAFYLSVIDNAIPHGGFCLGFDRLIAKLLDLEMITDAVAFPRTSQTLIP